MRARRSTSTERIPQTYQPGLEITQYKKDVKNEDRSGDIYETKDTKDKMPENGAGFLSTKSRLMHFSRPIWRFIGRIGARIVALTRLSVSSEFPMGAS